MINRDNWKHVKAYLKYRREVDQISKSSQRLEESWLRQLLEWADDISFEKVSSIRPAYPEFVLSKKLSVIYSTHLIRSAYRFFLWLVKHRKGFSVITHAWMDTLKVPRVVVEHKEHEAVTIEEIRAISLALVQTLRERRIRASAVFWFLSGVRVGAFVTLPVSAIDLDTFTVKQWPKLGVRTKFSKHATTFLLDIPDLLDVVKEWDREVRAAGAHFWFASVDPETGKIDSSVLEVGQHRNMKARKDLKEWLSRVRLPYHSPHKFRHGHAVYALKQAKDIQALKAVSQNLMHANLSVTDGVYGIHSDLDVKQQIAALGKSVASAQNKAELIDLLKKLLKEYE